MAALRGQLQGLKARYEMTLVLAATAASSAFNICHAPEDILSRIMAVMPPLALFLAFEVLIRQLRSELHHPTPESDAPNDGTSARQKRSFPRANVAHEAGQNFGLNSSVNESEMAGKTALPRKQSKRSQISRRRSKIATLQDRGLAIADISKAVGASAATVRRDLSIIGQS